LHRLSSEDIEADAVAVHCKRLGHFVEERRALIWGADRLQQGLVVFLSGWYLR